jgi:hypothetical protein
VNLVVALVDRATLRLFMSIAKTPYDMSSVNKPFAPASKLAAR